MGRPLPAGVCVCLRLIDLGALHHQHTQASSLYIPREASHIRMLLHKALSSSILLVAGKVILKIMIEMFRHADPRTQCPAPPLPRVPAGQYRKFEKTWYANRCDAGDSEHAGQLWISF